jgi:hypothetical protein
LVAGGAIVHPLGRTERVGAGARACGRPGAGPGLSGRDKHPGARQGGGVPKKGELRKAETRVKPGAFASRSAGLVALAAASASRRNRRVCGWAVAVADSQGWAGRLRWHRAGRTRRRWRPR